MMVVMTSATVVMATAVTVFNSVIEIHGQHLFYWQGWCSGMDFDTELGEHLHGTLAESAAKHIRTTLSSKEAGHGSVCMFWRLFQDGFLGLSVFDGYDSYLWGLAKMRPQHSLVGGNGDFLILFHIRIIMIH